jgi:3-deoxy-manno-octulosonate cytidylyltransferase (CMP-KDO synthetase)
MHARGFGAEVVMTPETCRNGTERCAAAVEALGARHEIVVNLQGDAPLTPPWFVEALVAACASDGDAAVATPVLRCDADALAGFLEDRRHGRVGGTTAVFDRAGPRALLLQGGAPVYGWRRAGRREDSGLSPCRRLCLSPGGPAAVW